MSITSLRMVDELGLLVRVCLSAVLTGPIFFGLLRWCCDSTLPGSSHFRPTGFTSPNPVHARPSLEHLLHAGLVKSQTRRR